MQAKKHNAGFTMLEVLITMVILSIGLLGLAGMLMGVYNKGDQQRVGHLYRHSLTRIAIFDWKEGSPQNTCRLQSSAASVFNTRTHGKVRRRIHLKQLLQATQNISLIGPRCNEELHVNVIRRAVNFISGVDTVGQLSA